MITNQKKVIGNLGPVFRTDLIWEKKKKKGDLYSRTDSCVREGENTQRL